MDASFDAAMFENLQTQLVGMWPAMTLRRRDAHRTIVVLSSVSMNLPVELHPLLPAYEERYLIYVLSLASSPNTRVVYVTSQPILPRLLDYYLGLIPGLDRAEMLARVATVSVGDWSARPLTEKILERPALIERLRALIGDPSHAVIMPFVTTPLEARLSTLLGIPVYGPHPHLQPLGTKTGSRQLFAEVGIDHPRGAEGLRDVGDMVDAIDALQRDRSVDEVIAKCDASVSGLGNAAIDMKGADTSAEIEKRIRSLRPEDDALDADAFLQLFATSGGIIEERITGEDFCSPSVQLRASPEGGVEVLSTHDQILGGATGQTYFGCRFPARPAYAAQISSAARKVGEELSRRGAIARFAVDFVAVRRAGAWHTYAVEINLRNGGTTHPTLTLLALTEGDYDEGSAQFSVDGVEKHYVATDHLETPHLRRLTPDDVLDIADSPRLRWDAGAKTGPVFHLLSAVGVGGRVGVTAIANSPTEAESVYRDVEHALSTAAGG